MYKIKKLSLSLFQACQHAQTVNRYMFLFFCPRYKVKKTDASRKMNVCHNKNLFQGVLCIVISGRVH